jgi:hypothetical protein
MFKINSDLRHLIGLLFTALVSSTLLAGSGAPCNEPDMHLKAPSALIHLTYKKFGENTGIITASDSSNRPIGYLQHNGNNIESFKNNTLDTKAIGGNAPVPGIGKLLIEHFLNERASHVSKDHDLPRVSQATGSHAIYFAEGFLPDVMYNVNTMHPFIEILEDSDPRRKFCDGAAEFKELSSSDQKFFSDRMTRKAELTGQKVSELDPRELCQINIFLESLLRVDSFLSGKTEQIEIKDFIRKGDQFVLILDGAKREALLKRREAIRISKDSPRPTRHR